jgi:hypothetical protein
MPFRDSLARILNHADDKVLWRQLLGAVLDKLVLGAVVVAAGFGANFVLDSYRVEREQRYAQQRLVLEKQLDALRAISESYGKLVSRLMALTLPTATREAKHRDELRDLITDVVNVTTAHEHVLPQRYALEVERHLFLFRGVTRKDLERWPDYRAFVVAVVPRLNVYWRQMLPMAMETPEPDAEPVFELAETARRAWVTMGAEPYLDLNFAKWQREQLAARPGAGAPPLGPPASVGPAPPPTGAPRR